MRKLPLLAAALALACRTLAVAAPARGDVDSPYPASELFPVEPGRNAERGFAVAVDGDWLAVGAPRDDAGETAKDAGAVYLFHWSGTTWDQEAKLRAGTPRPNALLGFALALRGGVLAAGAPGEGAVYVFAQGDGAWGQVKRLTGARHGAGAFGRSLALDGDRLAVGAVALPDATGGAVYLYYRYRRDPWALEQIVSPQVGQEGERFASAVSLAGDVLAVGAPGYDVGADPPAADAGAVYVFQREPAGWQETARLLPPSGAGQQLGSSVVTDGAQILAGAPTAGAQGSNSGALYEFAPSPGGWGRQPLPAARITSGDQLGTSLALSGDLLVAGAPAPPPGKGTGGAHVFRRTGASWLEMEVPGAMNAEIRDLAGFAVAVGGERVVLGAVLGDQGDGAAGAAWSFRCPSGSPCAGEAEAVARDRGAGRVGVSVAMTAKYLAVGAPGDDGIAGSAVYMYRRAGQGWRQEARLTTDDPMDGFGSSVALDGERLIVGAPQGRLPPGSPDAGTRAGLAFPYSHSQSPQGSWDAGEGFKANPPGPGEELGTSVAIAGDVVAIGAPRVDHPGVVYLAEVVDGRFGQIGGFSLATSSEDFGAAVSLRGQLLAIGAPGEGDGAGAVHLAAQDSSGSWALAPSILHGAGDGFGSAVSLGDGVLAVGAPGSGSVSVFRTANGAWQPEPLHGPEDPAPLGLGASLSLLGNRLAVGAPDPRGPGRAFLLDLESSVWSGEIMPPQPLDEDGFGAAVALSKDFLVVASPGIARGDRVTVFALPPAMEGPP